LSGVAKRRAALSVEAPHDLRGHTSGLTTSRLEPQPQSPREESVLPATKVARTVYVVERKLHALSYAFERLAGLILRF
jgi:hypothetical protein